MLQGHQQHRQQQATYGDGHGGADIQQETQGDSQERSMGQGVAKVGHAPPDHEGPQGAGNHRQGQTCEQGVEQKISHACSFLRGHGGGPRRAG